MLRNDEPGRLSRRTPTQAGATVCRAMPQAYRFVLDPTPAQEQRLRSHAGAARFAWNWGLEQCRKRYEAEKQWYSAVDLHRIWNQAKRQNPELAWWKENSKCVYQEAFRNLDRALRDFIASKSGERNGAWVSPSTRRRAGAGIPSASVPG
jgi:transposase